MTEHRFLRLALIIVIAALALTASACSLPELPSFPSSAGKESVQAEPAAQGTGTVSDSGLPAAEKSFTVKVVDADGNTSSFSYVSSAATLGEALLNEGLISGKNSAAGFVVTEVNGISADYYTDGIYWELMVNGEYAPLPCDRLPLDNGAEYTFIAE